MRGFHRDLIRAAADLGITDIRIAPGGKHPRLVGSFNGYPIRYVVPFSPSDWRALRNIERDLRRACLNLGGGSR